MATEVPVDDYPARDRHQIQTLHPRRRDPGHGPLCRRFSPSPRAVVQPVRVPAFPHRLLPAGARASALHRGDGLLVHPPPGAHRPGAERERGDRLGDERSFASAYAESASRRLLRHRHRAFVSLVVVLAMFEQLGWSRPRSGRDHDARAAGALSRHRRRRAHAPAEDFFASGRRVPPVYNGFVLAAVAVGGVGFLAYTGTAFFLGFDAMAIGLGWTFGMFAAGVLFMPYLRKAGSYTLPSFLGHRFRSRSVRMAASVAQLPPTALLLAAEIKIAALIASLFLPVSFSFGVVAGGRADRRHRHSRRHAVGDLGGQRGVYRRRGRSGGGGDHRVGAAHQSAGAATHLWRDLHRLAECRDHRRTDPGAAGRAPRRPAGSGAIADRQAVPATVRHSRPDGLRDAVSLPCARHRGAAEPARAKRRDQLDPRPAPLDGVGPPVRRHVRHDRAGHGRVRQADHLPRHRAGAGVGAAGLARRAERQAPAPSSRRQWRRLDRRGRVAARARRHRAGAAGGGGAALRARRADGDGGHGDRARGVGLPSIHPGGEPGRRPLPGDRSPPHPAAARSPPGRRSPPPRLPPRCFWRLPTSIRSGRR